MHTAEEWVAFVERFHQIQHQITALFVVRLIVVMFAITGGAAVIGYIFAHHISN